MERKHEREKNIKHLLQIFNELTAYGEPYHKTASSGTFESIRAYAACSDGFSAILERALYSPYLEYRENSNDLECRRAVAEQTACDLYDLECELRELKTHKDDIIAVRKAIRKAVTIFVYYKKGCPVPEMNVKKVLSRGENF